MRIATYNIRNGRAPDWSSLWWRRRRRLGRVIESLDADVWALQEVFPFQRRWLERAVLDHHAWVGSGRDRHRRGEGLYVVADRNRSAIDGHEVRWFGPTPERPGSKLAGAGFPRIAVLARLRVEARPVLVVDVHLDERSERRRAASLRQIAGWLAEEGRAVPVVVLGDFNARTGSAAFEPLRELGLVALLGPNDPGTSHGFHRHRPHQIDNLWVSPSIGVRSVRVAAEAGTASDHDPVVAELQLP